MDRRIVPRGAAVLGSVALLLGFGAACAEQSPPAAPAAESAEAQPAENAAAQPEEAGEGAPTAESEATADESYWVLTEFDWGDDREVVLESTLFDPFFQCRGRARGGCALVMVRVDGEELLARFHYHEERLFQVVLLTPDLGTEQAQKHLWRVWSHLEDYTTRHLGVPAVETIPASALPELDSLAFGPPVATRVWRTDEMVARLMVGRRDADLYYTGVFFSNPELPEAYEAHQAQIAERDEALRARRAGRKAG